VTEPPRESDRQRAARLTVSAGVLIGMIAGFAVFYVYIPFDSALRLVAFSGMFVMMIVVVALLTLFDQWARELL
jgi:high-affinity Fe2+/Pb2+ permease